MQVVAATNVEYLPAKHGAQVAIPVAPTAVENLPASQFTHPTPYWYVPAGQSRTQALRSSVEYFPAPQIKHVDVDIAPVPAEYFPTSQSTQDVALVTVEYLPSSHSKHADEPKLTLYLPASQLVQLEMPIAPVVSKYLPALQACLSASPPSQK